MSPPFDVVELATTYANKSAQDILKLAFAEFGDDLWLSFSGAEDLFLVYMAWKLHKDVQRFSVDPGGFRRARRCWALHMAAMLSKSNAVRGGLWVARSRSSR